MKDIIILGSTGSIGTQALDVIESSGGLYRVKALVAGNNYQLLARQAMLHKPETIIIGNKEHFKLLKKELSGFNGKVLAGMDEVESYSGNNGKTLVLAAMVGFAGLRPVLSAIRAGCDIALANKETLVVAGDLVTREARISGSKLIPVDSEHSAIMQCLEGERKEEIEKITLTASGGPFRGYTLEMLEKVSPDQALKHPNWTMGNKVTIDSASLMNKGLEVIEARWLFDILPEFIEVVVHPQSIIHSFVTFRDGSVKAQLGNPDMRFPIAYAFSWPRREFTSLPRTDITNLPVLTFEKPDLGTFRNLSIAYDAIERGGNIPCAMNAANEIAVDAFLSSSIGFNSLPIVIGEVIKKTKFEPFPGIDQLSSCDLESREIAGEIIHKIANRK